MILDKFLIAIGFQVNDKDLKKLEKQLKGVGKAAAETGKYLAKGFGLATGLASALVTKTALAAAETARMAEQLGISNDELSTLSYVAERAGVSTQTLSQSMQELSKRSAEAARGEGPAKDAYARLGISIRDANQNLKQSPQLLREISTQMRGLARSQQIELADKLFGGSGVQMLRLLDKGGDEIRRVQQELRDLGGVARDSDVALSEKFQEGLVSTQAILKSFGLILGRVVLPVINKMVTSLKAFWKAQRALAESVLMRRIKEWKEALMSFWGGLTEVQKKIAIVAAAVVALGIALATPFLGPLIAIGLLFLAIDDFLKFMRGDGLSFLDLLMKDSVKMQLAFALVAAAVQTVVDAVALLVKGLGYLSSPLESLSKVASVIFMKAGGDRQEILANRAAEEAQASFLASQSRRQQMIQEGLGRRLAAPSNDLKYNPATPVQGSGASINIEQIFQGNADPLQMELGVNRALRLTMKDSLAIKAK